MRKILWIPCSAFLLILACNKELEATGLIKNWCVNYYSSDGGTSRATGVISDINGKIYLVGEKAGNIWVAKINPGIPAPSATGCSTDASIIAWTRQLSAGIAYAIAIDSPTGHLVVLASLAPTGQCWVAKFDSITGNTLAGWPKTLANCYAGSPTSADGPRGALELDPSGNILVGGWPYSGGPVANFQLIKLDSSGSPVGAGYPLNYNSGTGDTPHDIAVDSQGRPYMIGETASTTVLLRTNAPGGSWAWSQTFNWIGYAGGQRHAVVVDQNDNVISAGQFFNSAGGGMYLYSWDKNGFPLYNWWYYSVYLGGGQVFHNMALGPTVCGGSLFTTGNTGWIGRFNAGSGLFMDTTLDPTSDHGEGIAVDPQGFIYPAGMGATGGVWLAQYAANCAVPPPPPCPTCGGPPPPPSPNQPPCQAFSFPNPGRVSQGPVTLRWQLSQASDADLEIWDLAGSQVQKWHFVQNQPGGFTGMNQIQWDYTNGKGQRVMKGMYLGRIQSRDQLCKTTWMMGVLP